MEELKTMETRDTQNTQTAKRPYGVGRIRKAVEEYERKYPPLHDFNFRLYDFNDVLEMASELGPKAGIADIVLIAFKGGFMFGYRRAQREAKKRMKLEKARMKERQEHGQNEGRSTSAR